MSALLGPYIHRLSSNCKSFLAVGRSVIFATQRNASPLERQIGLREQRPPARRLPASASSPFACAKVPHRRLARHHAVFDDDDADVVVIRHPPRRLVVMQSQSAQAAGQEMLGQGQGQKQQNGVVASNGHSASAASAAPAAVNGTATIGYEVGSQQAASTSGQGNGPATRTHFQAYRWFDPSTAPSPAALYLWRKDHCMQNQLCMGSTAERIIYEDYVNTSYHPGVVGEILSGQQNHERYLSLCVARCRNGDAAIQHRDEDAAQMTVDRIMHNVVEAICTTTIASIRGDVDHREINNRKAVPTSMFRDRNAYQADWHDWCRAQETNALNILLDYAIYASHHPYSIYHKSKYGDYGSPHPYVPYSITASNDMLKSQVEQNKQEQEALDWIASRRAARRTQADLDAAAAAAAATANGGTNTASGLEGTSASTATPASAATADLVGNVAADAVADNANAPGDAAASAATMPPLVPVSVPDAVVIDQEVEQPEAMVGDVSAQNQRQDERQTQDSVQQVQAQAQAQVQAQAQPAVQPVDANMAAAPTQQQAKVAAATSHSHPITVSIIVPNNLMDWVRRAAWQKLQRSQPKEVLDYLSDGKQRDLPWPVRPESSTASGGVSGGTRRFPSWTSDFARLPPIMNLAAIVTEDEMPWRIAQRDNDANAPTTVSTPRPVVSPPLQSPLASSSAASPAVTAGLCQSKGCPRWSSEVPGPAEPPADFKVGNLYLSSCPGKKVRLTGAVRGRGAVCRDLATDLQRFKNLGVGTLVCCLSDAELETIGVKWQEYLTEADKLGLDLIRIPIVEGHCPTSQAGLDLWLNEIVLHCTLKGINVLVHCRGGVGRAGTLAACWLIKMGLVDEYPRSGSGGGVGGGEFGCEDQSPTLSPSSSSLSSSPSSSPPLPPSRTPLPSSGLEMMWQSVQVVRLRRSTKAIETAEQAAYVANFGEYIAKKGGVDVADLRSHLELTRAFWTRLRGDAQEWVGRQRESRLARERDQAASAQAGIASQQKSSPHGNGNGIKAGHTVTSERFPASSPAWASNVNSRHAAQLPAVAVNGSGGEGASDANANGNANESVSVSAATTPSATPTPTSSSLSSSLSTASSTPPTDDAAVATVATASTPPPTQPQQQARLDANGEPHRKRRNTSSLSVEEMRLDDGAHAQQSATQGQKVKAAAADDDEMELDAFPVNGRVD